MDHQQIAKRRPDDDDRLSKLGDAKRRRDDDDRLSKLGDGVVGHILSFLDPEEAMGAAALSSRWRDIFASVHTLSFEQPETPLPDYDSDGPPPRFYDPNTSHFTKNVMRALSARSRRQAHTPAALVPLRALRVALESYGGRDASIVDEWIATALMDAAPKLDIDLCLARVPLCISPDPRVRAPYVHVATSLDEDVAVAHQDDDAASSSDESVPRPWELPPAVYTVPSPLFSCSALRSLRLGSCRLRPPETVSLPSLEALHLTHVGDDEEHLQRLISACPHLADLTLEACGTMTALSLLDNTGLRRLALRCCHNLAAVTVHASELRCFEYRGTIPDNSFLTVPGREAGSGGFPSVTSCKIEVCTVCVLQDTAMPDEQLAKLGSFLELFVSTKQLHLCAAQMSSCFVNLPAFTSLTHLQLHGCVRHHSNDDPTMVAATTITILPRVPNLEVLTLFFEAGPHEAEDHPLQSEGELLDAHHLHYNEYDTLDLATVPVPRCLGSKVRRINLVHYQGGRAQRMLARFLLGNSPLLEKLFCVFAEGSFWIQAELVREMQSWVINERASKVFR